MALFCEPGINHTVFENCKEGSILISLLSLALLKNNKKEHMLLPFKGGWTVSATNIIQQALEIFMSQPESLLGLQLQHSLSALFQMEASVF